MGNKIAFILPIAIILLTGLFILSTSKGTPISKQFSFNLLTPTPYKRVVTTPSQNPTSTPIPSPTPYINPKSYIPATKFYTAAQIQYFKNHDQYGLIANLKLPPLPKVKSTDTQIPVYMFNCTDDITGIHLLPVIDYIPRDNSPIFRALDLFARKPYGNYPTESEITQYQQNSGTTFVHRVGGVNQVILDKDGRLRINYYDSVRAYGGGSSRLSCMGWASVATAFQFPQVKSILDCIDKMPTGPDSCPYDFQP